MEKRTCTKCLNTFTLTDSEIDFYKRKGLNLPKKCKTCREEAKKTKSKDVNKPTRTLILIAVCVAMFFYLKPHQPIYVSALPLIAGIVGFVLLVFKPKNNLSHEALDEIAQKYGYTFANTDTFKEHYLKHGKETDCKTPEEYLKKANRIINNKNSVKKLEKEDKDQIYFDPDTCGIVFVSKYNKIRTFYISDWDYFNRQ